MSESSLTHRKRTVAFVLKDGRRGFAVEYTQASFLQGFTRFIDCAVWPENRPELLKEYTTFDIPTDMIAEISEATETKKSEEKPKRKRKEE